MRLTDMTAVRSLLQKYDISPQKRYGQNFLINENTVCRIADAAGNENEKIGIIEIGPGIGTLTEKLAMRYPKVVSIELDSGLLPVLAETLAEFDNVTILHADALKTDFASLAESYFPGMRVAVCANLPYYITSPIIMHLLAFGRVFESITIMIQKEVADRLLAAPGTPEYGAITAVCAYYAKTEKCFSVSAANFIPPPKVTSEVIRMNLYREPPVQCKSTENLMRIIRGAFAKRRKTLVNSLAGETSNLTKPEIEEALVTLGYRADIRGEMLGLSDFAKISDVIEL